MLWLCLKFKANGLFIRVKTLSSTNKVDSRHKKGRGPGKIPYILLTDVSQKQLCLLYKLPNM